MVLSDGSLRLNQNIQTVGNYTEKIRERKDRKSRSISGNLWVYIPEVLSKIWTAGRRTVKEVGVSVS